MNSTAPFILINIAEQILSGMIADPWYRQIVIRVSCRVVKDQSVRLLATQNYHLKVGHSDSQGTAAVTLLRT